MNPDHDDDTFAEQLFAAARREGPSEVVKQRALRAAAPAPRASRQWRWLLLAAALAGLVALLKPRAPAPLAKVRAEPARIQAKTGPALRSPAPVPALQPAAAAASTPPSTLAPPARSASPKARPATLEEELAMVDRARQSLLDGDSAAALAGLAQYDKLATSRRLGAEATLLRIQILASTGRAAEASRLAGEFVARNPNNPLVDRAKSYISKPAEEN